MASNQEAMDTSTMEPPSEIGKMSACAAVEPVVEHEDLKANQGLRVVEIPEPPIKILAPETTESTPITPTEDDSDDDSDDSNDGDDDGYDEDDVRTETCVDGERSPRPDVEVERHDTQQLTTAEVSRDTIMEASRTALFRRYSKLTPPNIEEQDRLLASIHECTLPQTSLCPETSEGAATCQNPSCVEQLRWRDARILELQAALDHMTEAMAIQQRDIASQRVYVSRQAEQLTNLSIKLHQEKVSLHVERERFQRSLSVSSAAKVAKQTSEKLKSPVKKLLSKASGRRATIATPVLAVDLADRSSSTSQLRLNPLVSALPHERSASLSTLDSRQSSDMVAIAITPPKMTTTSPSRDNTANGAAIDLSDSSQFMRTDRMDSFASTGSDTKKPSLGDRLRSIRWTRS